MNYSDEDFKSTVIGNIMFNTDGKLLISINDMISCLRSISNSDLKNMAKSIFDFEKVGIVIMGKIDRDVDHYAKHVLTQITNKFVK
jgi:hypothetical protein